MKKDELMAGVRNFWLNARVDGRKNVITGGPANKEGHMDVTVFIREEGESVEAVSILCRPLADGTNRIVVNDRFGIEVHSFRVKR